MFNSIAFDHVWIKTLVLILVHLAAPRMSSWLAKKENNINSFGGGMAISYVFIHLLPEIGEGKEHLGIFTFIITLAGFTLFSFLSQLIKQRESQHKAAKKKYGLSLLGMWFYSFILIVGLPFDYSQSHAHIMLMTFAAMLHVIHSDYELESEHAVLFKKKGRFILATAPIIGLLVRWFLLDDSDLIVHAITSILAGAMIYSIARKDVPTGNRYTIIWFVLGILTYTGLLLVIEII